MHHQHRDLTRLIGLEHVDPLGLFGRLRMNEARGGLVEVAQFGLIEGISQSGT